MCHSPNLTWISGFTPNPLPRIQWSKQALFSQPSCSQLPTRVLFPGLQVPICFLKTPRTFLTFARSFAPQSNVLDPHTPSMLVEILLNSYNSNQLEALPVTLSRCSSSLPSISSVPCVLECVYMCMRVGVYVCISVHTHFEDHWHSTSDALGSTPSGPFPLLY